MVSVISVCLAAQIPANRANTAMMPPFIIQLSRNPSYTSNLSIGSLSKFEKIGVRIIWFVFARWPSMKLSIRAGNWSRLIRIVIVTISRKYFIVLTTMFRVPCSFLEGSFSVGEDIMANKRKEK